MFEDDDCGDDDGSSDENNFVIKRSMVRQRESHIIVSQKLHADDKRKGDQKNYQY